MERKRGRTHPVRFDLFEIWHSKSMCESIYDLKYKIKLREFQLKKEERKKTEIATKNIHINFWISILNFNFTRPKRKKSHFNIPQEVARTTKKITVSICFISCNFKNGKLSTKKSFECHFYDKLHFKDWMTWENRREKNTQKSINIIFIFNIVYAANGK